MDNAHEGMVWSLAWHPLGHILCSGSNDHTSKFWTRSRPGEQLKDRCSAGVDDADIRKTLTSSNGYVGVHTQFISI